MKRQDIASGLVLAGVGIFVTLQARTLTYRDEFGPGPGLLPFWLGLILTALALCQAGSALWRGIEGRTPNSKGSEIPEFGLRPSIPRSRIRRVLLACVGLVATVALMEVLGFIASFGLLSFFLVYVVERRSLPSAIAVAVAMTLSFLLLFRVILPVPLPLSPWGF